MSVKNKQSKNTKTQKNIDPISFNEFIAWLSGVEDMQPEDWSPNLEQWTRIRNKLNSVKVDSPIDNRGLSSDLPKLPIGLQPLPYVPQPQPQPYTQPSTLEVHQPQIIDPSGNNTQYESAFA